MEMMKFYEIAFIRWVLTFSPAKFVISQVKVLNLSYALQLLLHSEL